MSWNLEQSIDTAIAAYLKPLVTGDTRVYAGNTKDELQYPCAVVHTGEGENQDEDAGFNGHRINQVHILVMVEVADEKDDEGAVIRSALQRLSDTRGDVMGHLAKLRLETALNDVDSPGVKFSLAQVTTTSDPVIEGRLFIAEINVEVIANPTEN